MGHFEHINDLRKVAGISLSFLQKNANNLTCRKHHRVFGSRKFVQHTDSRFAFLVCIYCTSYCLHLFVHLRNAVVMALSG